MYCSNSKFVDVCLQQGASAKDMADHLRVIRQMLKTWWSALHLSSVRQKITEVAPDLMSMIELLYKFDKLDSTRLGQLIGLFVAQSGEEASSFEVRAPQGAESIAAYLREQYPHAQLSEAKVDELSVRVAGGGKYYKRSLKRDLDTLLA